MRLKLGFLEATRAPHGAKRRIRIGAGPAPVKATNAANRPFPNPNLAKVPLVNYRPLKMQTGKPALPHGNQDNRAMTSRFSACAGQRRTLKGGVFLATMLAMGGTALADVTVKATYAISVGGITIGHANATARFKNDGTYAAAINGSTNGLSRLVSDSRAVLAGAGHIVGPSVIPTSYNLSTNEDGFATHVRIGMSDRSVVNVDAEPPVHPDPDRIPVTAANKKNVLDPVGAFMIALDRPDNVKSACDRTLSIFDGWQRFDVALTYKETKNFTGGFRGYKGTVIACKARFVPIAGHRKNGEDVSFLAKNSKLEVWLAPIKGTNLMVPVTFVIGTEYGDLIVRERSFQISG